jgi:hypothetical protein
MDAEKPFAHRSLLFRRIFRKDRANCRIGHRVTAPTNATGNALPTGGKVRPPAEIGKIAPFLRVRRKKA